MPRSLIFIHQYFAPELAGSAQQLTDLALGLHERGYAVKVLTGQPSYSTNGKLPPKENLSGVQVHRVPKLQLSRHPALGRILSAVSFFLMVFLKLFRMDRQALLVLGSDPPFLSFLGWFFHLLRGQRYALILSDIYPDVAVALGELKPRGWMVKLLETFNHLAYAKAEKIIVLGEKMRERIQVKLPQGEARGKIEVIHNWADGQWIRPLEKTENLFRKRFLLMNRLVVLFSGNLGKIYNFEDVFDAASSLANDPAVEFLFIGDGPLRKILEKRVLERGLKNIRLLPYQPKEELPQSLTCGDLVLVPLKEEVTGLCVPGKLYTALAAGLPLLVMASEDSEAARIVLENDCGWRISPGDVSSLAGLLRKLSQDPTLLREKGEKARRCFETHFTRERALRQYESVFSSA